MQVRALIGSFGPLKAFTLLKDASGQSTGSALAEFSDPGVLNAAIAGLSVVSLGPERLIVTRAANQEHVVALQTLIQQQQTALMARLTGQPIPGSAAAASAVQLPPPPVVPAPAAAAAAAPPLPEFLPPPPASPPAAAVAGVAGAPSAGADSTAVGEAAGVARTGSMTRADSIGGGLCVVRLEQMVVRDELLDGEEYEDILEDTREEVAKYGPLKQVGRERWGRRGTMDGTWGAHHWVGAYQQPSSCVRRSAIEYGRGSCCKWLSMAHSSRWACCWVVVVGGGGALEG